MLQMIEDVSSMIIIKCNTWLCNGELDRGFPIDVR
jgi:hypothetical protein